MTPAGGREADGGLPAEGTPAYWHLLTQAALYIVDRARPGMVDREVVSIVVALQDRYRHGLLDLTAILLADVQVRCSPQHRTRQGLPDLDLLAPATPDAVTVLETASKANSFFGRGPSTAEDITGVEEHLRVHTRTRTLLTAAWRKGAAAPDPQSVLPEIRAALAPMESDLMTVSSAFSLATAAAIHTD